jgi:hypothetical protein
LPQLASTIAALHRAAYPEAPAAPPAGIPGPLPLPLPPAAAAAAAAAAASPRAAGLMAPSAAAAGSAPPSGLMSPGGSFTSPAPRPPPLALPGGGAAAGGGGRLSLLVGAAGGNSPTTLSPSPSPRANHIFIASAALPPPGTSKKPAAPKRNGWGRSVLPQDNGLWNASPFHPASPSASPALSPAPAAPVPAPPARAGAASGPPSRSASGRLAERAAGGAAAAGAAAAAAAGRLGAPRATAAGKDGFSVVCVPAPAGAGTKGSGTLHMKLDPETAAHLAALYRWAGPAVWVRSGRAAGLWGRPLVGPRECACCTADGGARLTPCPAAPPPLHALDAHRTPQKRDSADTLGYTIKRTSHGPHPAGFAAGAPGGSAGVPGGALGGAGGGVGAPAVLGEQPGFAAAKQVRCAPHGLPACCGS